MLSRATESDGKFPKARKYRMFEKRASNEFVRIPTRTVLREMLHEGKYHSLNNVFSFAAVFISQNMKCENTVPLGGVHTYYSYTVTDVTKDLEQRAWGKDDLCSVKSWIEKFKKRLADAFDRHRDLGLWTLYAKVPTTGPYGRGYIRI